MFFSPGRELLEAGRNGHETGRYRVRASATTIGGRGWVREQSQRHQEAQPDNNSRGRIKSFFMVCLSGQSSQ